MKASRLRHAPGIGAPRRGFALLTVLWMAALVGIAALELHTTLRADRAIAANLRDAGRARWAARGAVAAELARLQAALRVTALSAERLAPVGDTLLPPRVRAERGLLVHSTVLDVRARLHVNHAGLAELGALGEAVGLTRPEAAALAARVLAARAGGPIDIETLAAWPELGPERFGRLAPLLTTMGDGRINVNSAPTAVLRTLPGIDAEAARALVSRRAVAPFRSIYDALAALPGATADAARAALPALRERVALEPRVVEVRARAVAASGVGVAAEAVVLLAGGAQLDVTTSRERALHERTAREPPRHGGAAGPGSSAGPTAELRHPATAHGHRAATHIPSAQPHHPRG